MTLHTRQAVKRVRLLVPSYPSTALQPHGCIIARCAMLLTQSQEHPSTSCLTALLQASRSRSSWTHARRCGGTGW